MLLSEQIHKENLYWTWVHGKSNNPKDLVKKLDNNLNFYNQIIFWIGNRHRKSVSVGDKLINRQINHKDCLHPGQAFHLDSSPMLLDCPMTDRQAQPSAPAGVFSGIKWIKNPLEVLG